MISGTQQASTNITVNDGSMSRCSSIFRLFVISGEQ